MVARVSPQPAPDGQPHVPHVKLVNVPALPARLPRRRAVNRHPGIYYRPRPDGKVAPPYEFRYLDSAGNDRWKTVFGSLNDAEDAKATMRLRRRRGERIAPSTETFEQYAHDWLTRRTVRPRTLESNRWALEQHLIPYFGRRRLDQIHVDDIAACITHLRGKNLKGWTISSAIRPLSIILAHAARRGHIPINPFTQLERGERPSHGDQRPKRILSLDEMQTLLAHTDTERDRCLIELLLMSGVRIGEELGLVIANLNAADSIIQVDHQLSRDGTRTPLKTAESQRAIDIPPSLMGRLLALVVERDGSPDPSAFVFASRNGTGLERKTARNILDRAFKTAGLATPKPTLHDLRHSHASMLIRRGYDVSVVQHRLGHRKPDTTLRIYTHEWDYRKAQKSPIGTDLQALFAETTMTEPDPENNEETPK